MPTSTPKPTPARLGPTVVALGIVSLLTDLSAEMIYPLLPVFLSATLGASTMTIGAIEGAAESTASLLRLASGWWSDRLTKRKPLVVAGYLLAALVRPLVGIAQSATQVLAIRLTDRVGKGIRSAPRDALIADAVDPSIRGRAYGFHRAADHAGAVIGPLVAFVLLGVAGLSMRNVFLLAAIPGVLAVIVLIVRVREPARATPPRLALGRAGDLTGRFWAYLGVVLLFTLGNSSDAFLLLRAADLGVPPALIPILWAMLHVVKSASSVPGGALSDRIGRKPLIIAGWLLFAAVYLGFALADREWHAWALFALYGIHFGLTEGVEKALVSDIVPAARRGAAFGWYSLTIGVGALPASLLIGFIWERVGVTAAFSLGASLALLAAVGIAIVAPKGRPGPAPVEQPDHG